ncbi:MAG TPA: hypothetical protein VFV68_14990, partial [Agriterribacter sp.]|nr:hypothetical protein [Agriterribacter sp.]
SEARIEVYVQSNQGNNTLSNEEIKQRLNEDYQLDIAVNNNELTAIAKVKNKNMNWKKALSISFKVFVTNSIDTKLSTSGGSISLDHLSGNQHFRTSGGSLHVNDISGNIDGRTSGGSITLNNSSGEIDLATSGGSITSTDSKGDIKLHTSGGSLTLNDLKGKIDAATSGGSVKGEDIKGELIAHTSGGSINLKGLACSVETSTSGGNIAVEIVKLGEYTKIENSGGNIALEIPGGVGVNLDLHGNRINASQLTNFSGTKDDDRISGTLNGGGVPVNVRAGSGKISLTLK